MAALVALILAIALYATFGTYMLCDGSYSLAITVTSKDPVPIKWVSCQGCRGSEEADFCFKRLEPSKVPLWSDFADPFDGREMRISLGFSFKMMHGFTWDDSQFEKLVVIVCYQDDRRVGKLVDIPHRSVTHRMSVQFP